MREAARVESLDVINDPKCKYIDLATAKSKAPIDKSITSIKQ